jgi:hypothetical protein
MKVLVDRRGRRSEEKAAVEANASLHHSLVLSVVFNLFRCVLTHVIDRYRVLYAFSSEFGTQLLAIGVLITPKPETVRCPARMPKRMGYHLSQYLHIIVTLATW